MSDSYNYSYDYNNNYRPHRRARSLPPISNNRSRSYPYRRHTSVSPPRRSFSPRILYSPSSRPNQWQYTPPSSSSSSPSSSSPPSEPSPAYVPLPVPLAPMYRSRASSSPQVHFAPLSLIYIPSNTNNQDMSYDYARHSLQDAVVYDNYGDYDQVVPEMDN